MRYESLALTIGLLCFTSLHVAEAQTGVHLSESDKVMLSVDALRVGLQEGNERKVLSAFAHEFKIGEVKYQDQSIEQLVDSALSATTSRETIFEKPPQLPFSGYWDLGMEDFELTFQGDSCIVSCSLRLYAAPRNKGETPATVASLVFRKIRESWKLVQAVNLFEFLLDRGAK